MWDLEQHKDSSVQTDSVWTLDEEGASETFLKISKKKELDYQAEKGGKYTDEETQRT
jgi:hypothetical protein